MKKKVIEAEYQIDLLNQNDPAKNYVLSKILIKAIKFFAYFSKINYYFKVRLRNSI